MPIVKKSTQSKISNGFLAGLGIAAAATVFGIGFAMLRSRVGIVDRLASAA